MAGPDLTTARQQVANLMDDAVSVRRDPKGAENAVLDTVTGKLHGPGPDPDDSTVLYTGKALIRPQGDAYVVGLPWDAGDFQHGDVVTCTASLRDPELVGKTFVVDSVPYQTYLVVRQLRCTLRAVA